MTDTFQSKSIYLHQNATPQEAWDAVAAKLRTLPREDDGFTLSYDLNRWYLVTMNGMDSFRVIREAAEDEFGFILIPTAPF